MKLSIEVAEVQLAVLFDYYDLDVEDIVDEQQKDALKAAHARLLKAVRKGRLEIKEGGQVVQTLANPPGDMATITYGELTGKAKLEIDKKGAAEHHGRMYALLGALSGLGDRAISSLRGIDLSVAECLGLVFMLV